MNEVIDLSKIHSSSQLPDWHFIRLTNYNYRELDKIEQWLENNILNHYTKIGWHTACPYEVGVLFENEFDAMAYKLTWVDGSGAYDDSDEEDDDDEEDIWV